ncbi:MAG: beta-N-acetylhexosaminidase [Gammaproteobacteria bacterium]|nr:beta-N-acetylhexosaminidase [Gammaproteobacteria bacterium]
MTLGPVMLDLESTTLSPEEREMLRHPQTGGVILFTRNYTSVGQLHELTVQIHALRKPRLLVSVDHEGGRVQRFRSGFTRLPAPRKFGQLFNHNREQGLKTAEQAGWLMAAELRAVGVDFSFAPVLDLDRGVSGVIGDRAFHRDPQIVAELARAYMLGMRRAGMAAVGKHFPGHGAVAADSHTAMPVDSRAPADIMLEDVLPFERMIHYGLAGVMPAHVVYERADTKPAGYSDYWLQMVLRQRLGFQGAIFSDDLSMAGAERGGDYGQRAVAALNAGCDMALVCNNPAGAATALAALGDYDAPASQVRLTRLHGQHDIDHNELRASGAWRQAEHRVRSTESSTLEMDV